MRKKLFCALIVLIVAISTLMAEGQQEVAKVNENGYSEIKVPIAILPQYHGYLLDAADQQNYFSEFGVKPDMQLYGSGAPMNEALASNQWMIGSMGVAAVTAYAKYGAKIVASSCNEGISQYFYMRKDNPMLKTKGYLDEFPNVYGTSEALKGQTIITTVGTSLHYDVEKLVTAFDMEMTDVQILNMDPGSAVAAFKSGQGDMLVTCVPFSWGLDELGFVRAFTVKDLGGEVPSVIVVSEKTIKEHPDYIVQTLAGFFKSTERAQRNKEAILAEHKAYLNDNGYEPNESQLEDEYLKEIFNAREQVEYFTPGENGLSPMEEILFDNARYMLSVGGINQAEYDDFVANAVDNSFIMKVAELPEFK